jgi:ribosome-associated protein
MKITNLPQTVRAALEAAQSKQAAGIVVLDLSGMGAFTDYFIICTAFSTPQLQAVCYGVEEALDKLDRSPDHREGGYSSDWALLDYGGFVVHAFSEQGRKFYDLERLWRTAKRLDIPDEPVGSFRGTASESLHP